MNKNIKKKATLLGLTFIATGLMTSCTPPTTYIQGLEVKKAIVPFDTYTPTIDTSNTAPLAVTNSGKTVSNGDFVNEGVTITRNGTILHIKNPSGNISSAGGQPTMSVSSTATNGWYECWSSDSNGNNRTDVLKFYLDTNNPTGAIYQRGTYLMNDGAQLADDFSFKATDSGSGIKDCYVRRPNSSDYTRYVQGTLINDTSSEGWYYFYAVDNAGNRSKTYSLYLVSNRGVLYYKRDGFASNTIAINGSTETQEKKIFVNEGCRMDFRLTEASFDSDSDIKSGTYTFTKSSFPNSIYYIKGTGNQYNNKFKIAVVIIREKPKVKIGTKEYLDGSTTYFRQDQMAKVITSSLFDDYKIYSCVLYMTGNTSGSEIVSSDKVDAIDLDTPNGSETSYRIRIVDAAQNVSNITFVIDKKVPTATWYKGSTVIGNDSKVNEPIKLTFTESNVTAKLIKNNGLVGDYTSGTVLSEDGRYRITLTDVAGNTSTYTAIIDTTAPKGTIYADDKEVGTGTYTNKDIRFEWEDTTATCLVNGSSYKMNTPIKEEGSYEFVLKDAIGNKSTYNITIDKTAPSANNETVNNKNDNIISKFYQVKFDDKKSSFKTYEEALEFAKKKEREKFITELTLNNVDDFTQDHLVADNGDPNNHNDEIRTGKYWRYKSQANPSIELYYFDSELLDKVVSFYASKYITGPIYHNGSTTPDYGDKSDSMFDSVWGEGDKKAKIGNDIVLAKTDSITAIARLNGTNEDIPLSYDTPLGDLLATSGLYTITEIDLAGNSSSYQVYIDHDAPSIKATVSVMGEEKEREITIDKNSLDGIKSYYYKSFKVNQILDSDNWALISVSNGKKTDYYSKEDNLPTLNVGGKYVVTAYDRLGNSYSFNVYIVGNPAEIAFKENKEKTLLDINITLEQDFDTVVSLEITKDGKKLDGITTDKLSYQFDKGGLYKVTLKDNFGRVIAKEYDFKKAKPVGTLTGVTNNGRTKGDVTFTFDKDKFHAEVTKNGTTSTDKTGNLGFIDSGNYTIRLIRNDDFDSYEIYSFEIDKVAPSIKLEGAENNSHTNSDVTVSWDDSDVAHAYVSFNGGEKTEFTNGATFKEEGSYEITLVDTLANESKASFIIDRTLNYSVKTGDGKDLIGTDRTTKDVIIDALEEGMDIKVSKDGKDIPYSFGDKLDKEGTYVIRITDSLGNVKSFTIVIDRSVDASLNVMDGSITNEDVTISSNEDIEVTITKDGEAFSYEQGQSLTEEGHYHIILKDKLGNTKEYDFYILKTPKTSIDYELGEGVEITEVKKDGEVIEHEGNNLNFSSDGTYEVTVTKDGETSTFTITLDTTAPTVVIEGVEDGGTVDGKVTISSMNEEGTILVTKDGEVINYKLGDELSEYGHYEVTVTDLLGNSKTYSFDLAFKMNGWSIALIAIGCLTIVGGVIAIIVNRKKIFKKRK